MRVEKMQNLNDIRDTVSKLIRLYESQNYKKVIRTFSKNKEALVKNADALNILGATYVELGKQTEALNSYKKALLVDGKHSDTLNNLGILFFNLGDFEKAIEFYNQAKSTGLKNKNILNNLANSYRALGQFQKALENYSAALNHQQVHLNLPQYFQLHPTLVLACSYQPLTDYLYHPKIDLRHHLQTLNHWKTE